MNEQEKNIFNTITYLLERKHLMDTGDRSFIDSLVKQDLYISDRQFEYLQSILIKTVANALVKLNNQLLPVPRLVFIDHNILRIENLKHQRN